MTWMMRNTPRYIFIYFLYRGSHLRGIYRRKNSRTTNVDTAYYLYIYLYNLPSRKRII